MSGAALGALGLTADDFDDGEAEEAEIWPDTLVAHNAYVALSTQWNTSYGGMVGLKYESIPIVFRMIGIPRKEWPELFEDLRVMEAESLNVFAEQQERQRG